MDEQIELSYQGLKNMKKNDFIRLFKKPIPWKKAQAILFLAKYKFNNGKVNLVAVPYKKYNEAAKVFKPNNELGGIPYDYDAVIWSETYPNPGYKVENGKPLPIKK